MRVSFPSPRFLLPPIFGLICLVSGLIGLPGDAVAQGDAGCDVPNHGGMVMTTLSNETRMFFFTSPTIRCPGGVRITADSARVFESTNYTQLWGDVVFSDEDSRLSANQAQYFSEERRLVATGNSVLTDLAEGSVIVGDNMTLIRAGPNRPEDFLTVGGRRPHATLYPTRRPAEEEAPPDTAGGREPAILPDSVAVRPDSAAAAPDSVVVRPDSVATPPDPMVPDPEAEVDRVPYEIDAQRFVLEGTQFFRATGSVVVTRDSLRAVADSLEYEPDAGALFLSGSARVTTGPTDLAADAIRLDIPEDEVREADATGDAVLNGEDLRLLAPVVHLFFSEGGIERLMARRDPEADTTTAGPDPDPEAPETVMRGPPHPVAAELGLAGFPLRPYAVAQDFILEGDSLEVLAPGEVLEEVWAMGKARGESMAPDSLAAADALPLISRDWLEGDTIVAVFGAREDSLPSVDEPFAERRRIAPDGDPDESKYVLKRLVAKVGARSMYRMAPSDSTLAAEGNQRAIHYVIGDEITIVLNAEGEAEHMEVIGQTRGIHLEPLPRRGEPVDTMVVPDTASVRGGGGGSGT